ncbi:hypothetical protein DFS34DRAFT_588910 [Phlyctochytrium arcticum]|nr:hypothetical protein DFS34DRAFT_588910 [Phlyctochytrium arcticum]
MASGAYYLESLRDGSDKISTDPSLNRKSPGGVQTGGIQPGTFRRARAETFSFFPSKLLPEAAANPIATPPVPTLSSLRSRSGSLSLPRSGISNAFGPSLFATSWQSANSAANTISERDYVNSATVEDETNAVARTLDYLGLDDPVSDSGRHFPTQSSYGQSLPRPSGPSGQSAYSNAGINRARSYSVAVGENLAISIPDPTSYRPRASSIAFLESTTEPDLQALRRSIARGEIQLELSSPDSDHRGDGDRLSAMGRVSPKDYMMYGIDRSDSPTRLFHDHPHQHQLATRSLWIGNIDPTLSPSDLLTLFSPFGPIESLRILPDKECAFVNYVRVEDAMRARDEMQGGRVGNSIVRIGFGKAEAINDTQGMQPTKSLWIGNIPPSTDPAELEALFATFGPIESARVLTHKNCGFVNFFRLEDAMEARKGMNGKEIGESVVKIGFAKVPAKGGETAIFQLGGEVLNHSVHPMHDREPTPFMALGGGASAFASAAGLTPSPKTYSPMKTSAPAVTPRELGGGSLQSLHNVGLDEGQLKKSAQASGNATTPVQALQTGPTASGDAFSDQSSPGSATVPPLRKDSVISEFAENRWNDVTQSDIYASAIPPVPEPKPNRQVDQSRLREMRKRLETHATMKDVDAVFNEVLDETVDLCTDYIGNVVLQKIIEKSTDQHRLMLVERVAPHMAAIGIHKNGTWVVQKMIDYAKTSAQIQLIVAALKPFTPPLLLDQFGNYVVQCCLRLGTHRNQFVFDAMNAKCVEVGSGRFGARAMRACLESQYTTKRQQKFVAEAIVQNAIQLATNQNGAILITWLLDTSSLPGRYQALAPKLAPHVPTLCTHKLASATIMKLVNQRVELEARDQLIMEIFFRDEASLQTILTDHVHGVSVVQKILASACISPEEKVRLADRIRTVLARMPEVRDNQLGYKRLLDELSVIRTNLNVQGGGPNSLDLSMTLGVNGLHDPAQDIVSPLVAQPPIPYQGAAGTISPLVPHPMYQMGESSKQSQQQQQQQAQPQQHGWYSPTAAQLPTPPSHSPQSHQSGNNMYMSPNPGPYPVAMAQGGFSIPHSPYGAMPVGYYPPPLPRGSYPPSPQHPSLHQQQFQHQMASPIRQMNPFDPYHSHPQQQHQYQQQRSAHPSSPQTPHSTQTPHSAPSAAR